jgi:phosphatidylglycerophosphate synthase
VSAPIAPPEAPALAAAKQRASRLTSALVPGSALLGLCFDTLQPLALVGPLALALLLISLRAFGAPRGWLPNLVTALRVVLTGLLALSGEHGCTGALQAGAVLLIFTLDGLDGVLARRLGASSAQGAHFDMEADAYLVLTVCGLQVLAGRGWWVLTGGLLRYAYALSLALPWLRAGGEAPRTRFGRYAFAASLGCLTLGLLLLGPLGHAAALVGSAILLWSFGRSWWWAYRPA